MFCRLKHVIPHLRVSIKSQYGSSFAGYFKFIYYSCLRVNRFILYSIDIVDFSHARYLGNEYRFAEMTSHELDSYRQGYDFPKEFFADEIGSYDICHVVFKGRELAYIHWVSRPGKTTRFLRLNPGVVEIGYIATLPAFRKQGICSWALSEAFSSLRNQGVKKVVAVVHDGNTASRKAMVRVGMKEESVLRSIGPFNLIHKVLY